MRKPSFFEKLTGAVSADTYDDLFDDHAHTSHANQPHALASHNEDRNDTHLHIEPGQSEDAQDFENWQLEEPQEEQEGELAVDIYQTTDSIVVKALVAGVSPASIDISLTRDMITIRGNREEHKEVQHDNYFYRELYWGAFSRTILLPEEVDVDMADATTNHGILVIRLPKINKERKTKLKVKPR